MTDDDLRRLANLLIEWKGDNACSWPDGRTAAQRTLADVLRAIYGEPGWERRG